MNKRTTHILLVIGTIVILLITTCSASNVQASTLPAVAPANTVPSVCDVAVQTALAAMKANNMFVEAAYNQEAKAQFITDPNTSSAVKAGIINGQAYLANRPLKDAISLATKCNIATPKVDFSPNQLSQAYGGLQYMLQGNSEYPKVVVTSVMGGFPEIDYGVAITHVREGGTLDIFGGQYTFTFSTMRSADSSFPTQMFEFDIAYFDSQAKSELMMSMWSRDGKIIFSTDNQMEVVQVE